MKKVLFVSHIAGFSKFNEPFMHWFQDQGWRVHYASLGEKSVNCCDMEYSVKFTRSPYSIDNVIAYFQLKKIIADENYDIIHCHTPVGGAITRLAALTARKNGTKVIYTAHGFHFYKGAPLTSWLLYYPVEKYFSRYTDCLILINGEDYDTAIRRNFKASRIEKIDGVGVDLQRFSPVANGQKLALRKKHGYGFEDFILLCVAEFIPRKRQGFLLDSIPALGKSIPNIKLLLAGTGKLFDKVKQKCERLNLSDKVAFLGYRNDINELLQLSDILVSASLREGLPINIIEGMASGLPIVCTNIRGQVDAIERGRNGLLFEPDNKDEFIKSIERLYKDASLCEVMKTANVQDAKKYSVADAVDSMAKIYTTI